MKKILIALSLYHFITLSLYAYDWAPVWDYDVNGSLFQRIADLEQEKVLMQLERDRAQLQLDLDRLTAEKLRLMREQESADLRAEEQTAELERQRAVLEQERQRLDEQRRRMADEAARFAAEEEERRNNPPAARPMTQVPDEDPRMGGRVEAGLSESYALIEIIGAGNQLVATLEHLGTGQQRRLSVGRQLNGFTVKSISIDDGVELERDGERVTIGIGSFGRGGI